MRQRHRPPSIFSLSMLDVFACSLGCVTLLWLMNSMEADDRARGARQTHAELLDTRGELALTRDEAAKLTRLLAASEQLASETADARDVTRGELEAALRRLAVLEKDLLAMKKRADEASDVLTLRDKENNALTKERDDLVGRIALLDKSYKEQTTLALNAKKSATTLGEELALMTKKADDLADKLAATEKETKSMRGTLDERIAKLENELRLAKASLIDLAGQKKVLADEVDRVRAAADNRFAGINLTGKRVVLVIDISGSMLLVEEKVPDAAKWGEVRQTVVKLLKSLPDLEKYQVVLFSTKATMPLGEPGKWLDFDREKSPAQVEKLLTDTKPEGGTNMHAGLEAAFGLRDQGLDTIYLLSDGLPSLGVGLPANADTLTESQRVALLSGRVRSTLKTAWNPKPTAAGQTRVKINAVGFFYESPDVGAFLWALARENDGSFVGMSKP